MTYKNHIVTYTLELDDNVLHTYSSNDLVADKKSICQQLLSSFKANGNDITNTLAVLYAFNYRYVYIFQGKKDKKLQKTIIVTPNDLKSASLE